MRVVQHRYLHVQETGHKQQSKHNKLQDGAVCQDRLIDRDSLYTVVDGMDLISDSSDLATHYLADDSDDEAVARVQRKAEQDNLTLRVISSQCSHTVRHHHKM